MTSSLKVLALLEIASDWGRGFASSHSPISSQVCVPSSGSLPYGVTGVDTVERWTMLGVIAAMLYVPQALMARFWRT